jgi:hypothetical protein
MRPAASVLAPPSLINNHFCFFFKKKGGGVEASGLVSMAEAPKPYIFLHIAIVLNVQFRLGGHLVACQITVKARWSTRVIVGTVPHRTIGVVIIIAVTNHLTCGRDIAVCNRIRE